MVWSKTVGHMKGIYYKSVYRNKGKSLVQVEDTKITSILIQVSVTRQTCSWSSNIFSCYSVFIKCIWGVLILLSPSSQTPSLVSYDGSSLSFVCNWRVFLSPTSLCGSLEPFRNHSWTLVWKRTNIRKWYTRGCFEYYIPSFFLVHIS